MSRNLFDAAQIARNFETDLRHESIAQGVTPAEMAAFTGWMNAQIDQRVVRAWRKGVEADAVSRCAEHLEANAREDITAVGVIPGAIPTEEM